MTAPSHTATSVASTSRLVARGLTDTSSPPHPLSLSRSTRLRRRLARGLRLSDESSALSERSESKGSGLQGEGHRVGRYRVFIYSANTSAKTWDSNPLTLDPSPSRERSTGLGATAPSLNPRSVL